MVKTALERWRQALGEWRIPESIVDRVSESPWVLPRQVFVRRADAQLARPIGATFARASAALAKPGAVLDVGAAAGATSLPLAAAGRVTRLTAVDGDAELLDACAERAARIGVPCDRVVDVWPDSAEKAPIVDVVVCGNVLYNVADLEPFVAALTTHARTAVVVETAVRHPLTELNPLWRRFHDITRPTGPDVDDLLAALDELGIRPEVTPWRRPPEAEYENFAELVDVVRRRLCLTPDAVADVDRALRELGHSVELTPDLGSSGRELVTLSWPGGGD
jgi:2-polyprenyl-3-methyl-5-hydroxy-6-metoxy-1,4-benzoquinol methylase